MASSDQASLLCWLRVRDLLFGHNCVPQNIPFAVEMAKTCDHPDAKWLVTVFSSLDDKCKITLEEAVSRLQLEGWKGQFYADLLCGCNDAYWMPDLIRRAADKGDNFARACLFTFYSGEDNLFALANISAASGERDGICFLADCYMQGIGCTKDILKAAQLCRASIELGSVQAMHLYGLLMKKSDRWRYIWLGKAAARGHGSAYLRKFLKQLERQCALDVKFAIGEALASCQDKKIEFGLLSQADRYLIEDAISFYLNQCKCSKAAVDTWTLVGLRHLVCKDVRLLIGKIIWDFKWQANYVCFTSSVSMKLN